MRARSTTVLATTAAIISISARMASAEHLSIAEAVRRAEAAHPNIALADADVTTAAARVDGAALPTYNPEVSIALGAARGGGTFLDWEIGLSQPIERGGKRGKRVAVASASRDATRMKASQQRWLIRVEATRAFRAAIVARDRVKAADDALKIATDMNAAIQSRGAAGKGTLLEANVALANVGRAQRDALESARAYETARVALDGAVAAAPGSLLEPDGDLDAFPVPTWTEDQLAVRASRERPDVAIAHQDRVVAGADVALADSVASPELGVGITYGRSEGTDVVMVGVSIPLPVRNRNQGERRAARAVLYRSEVAERATTTNVEREARAAYRSYVAARAAVQAFDRDVIGTAQALDFSVQLGDQYEHMLKLEIVCRDERADRLAEVVRHAAHTGHEGDGVVLITPIDDALRISTCARGVAAIDP